MRLSAIFLLLSSIAFGQWTSPTLTGSSVNAGAYGGYRYNPWQSKMMAFSNGTLPNLIYATDVQTYDFLTGAFSILNFNGETHNNCPMTALDTSTTEPGSGHPGLMDYDWRHDWLFQHHRLECGVSQSAIWTWRDNLDNTSLGPWTRQATATMSAGTSWSDNTYVFDPVNNWFFSFGGQLNLSPTDRGGVWDAVNGYRTICASGGGCSISWGNTTPSIRGAQSIVFDTAWSNSHPGKARYIMYGGYNLTGVSGDPCVTGTLVTDLWNFYPNGDGASIPAWGWQQVSYTGGTLPPLCYGRAVTYDTLRSVVWIWAGTNTPPPSGTPGSQYLWKYNPSTSAITQYVTTGGSFTGTVGTYGCPSNSCGMVYDQANDALIVEASDNPLGLGGVAGVRTLSLNDIAPVTPSCGSGYSTSVTDYKLLTWPKLGYPAINTQYADPMGGCVKRVSASTGGEQAIPWYATYPLWDSGNRFLLLTNYHVLDAADGYLDIGVNVANYIHNPIWWRGTSGKIGGVGQGFQNTNQYVTCTVSHTIGQPTGSINCAVLKDFAGTYASCGDNSNLQQVSQMPHDQNDGYVVLACRVQGGSQNQMLVLNLQTAVAGIPMNIPPGPGSPGCGPSLGFGPNFAWDGILGNHIYVMWGVPGTGRYCGLESYQLAAAASPTGSWTSEGQISPGSDHGDLALYGGAEYWVSYTAQSSWSPYDDSGVARVSVPDGWGIAGGAHTGVTKMLNGPVWNGHISCQAYGMSDPAYCAMSDEDITADVNDTYRAFWQEVGLMYMDSTSASPHIKRIAHSYSDPAAYDRNNDLGLCPSSSYWAQPHAVVRNDGVQVAWGSSWGPSCRLETYVASLVNVPNLTLTKTHVGNWIAGDTGKTFSLTVTNTDVPPTNGTTVTVTDTLPAGLTATAMSGTGWSCTTSPASCTRSDVLASGQQYPTITLTVTVGSGASGTLLNSASVSGGGSATNATTDTVSVRRRSFIKGKKN